MQLPWWISDKESAWDAGEDPTQEEMETHSSILAGKTPQAKEPGGLQSMGLQESDMTEHPCVQMQLTRVSCQISRSNVQLFATPWTAARQASLSITNSWSLLKLISFKLVMPSNHLILYSPLILLPSIFPSIRISSKESVLHIR